MSLGSMNLFGTIDIKTGTIPRLDDIYEAFKTYADAQAALGRSRETLRPGPVGPFPTLRCYGLGARGRLSCASCSTRIEQQRAT